MTKSESLKILPRLKFVRWMAEQGLEHLPLSDPSGSFAVNLISQTNFEAHQRKQLAIFFQDVGSLPVSV